MESSRGGDSDVEAGLAKLQGQGFEYYMQIYSTDGVVSVNLNLVDQESAIITEPINLKRGMEVADLKRRVLVKKEVAADWEEKVELEAAKIM